MIKQTLLLTALFLCVPTLFAKQKKMEYVSQCGQDKFLIENLFKGKKNGIFVEIGAFDGIKYSNTYNLEVDYGWAGLCIEPIPEQFENL